MAERRKNGTFAKGSSGNAEGRRAEKKDVAPTKSNVLHVDAGWTNWITGHGVMGRDKREGTYFQGQELSFDALAELQKGDDLASRAVETPVKEALRPGWDIILPENKDGSKDEDGDENERVKDVTDKMKKLGVKQILKQAMCYERGMGGGAILLGANDQSTDLTKPLNLQDVKTFNWMTPLEPREIYPMYGYADPRQPKYGQPEIYRMTSRAVLPPYGGQYAETVFDVHESRLIVFPGIRVSRYQSQSSQGGWGDSVLVRMWRVLRDFNLAWGSAGVLVSEFARGTYKWKDLLDTLSTAQGRAGAEARLQFMEWAASTINATVIDANDDYKREAIPLAGLAELLNQFATRLAAAADQPLTVLFGTSPAGLNATGDSDIRLWYDRISTYREDTLLPPLERIIELCFLTTGDGQVPDKWSIRFRPLWQETAEERSKAMLTQAQADHTWYQDGVVSSEEIAESHWGTGEWNPDLKIDFEARKKQQLATHSAVTPEDLHALGRGNGPGPDGAPGGGKLPSGHPATPADPTKPPPMIPPGPGSAAKPGTANTTGGQNFPPSTKAKANAAAPDPETPPQPNVENDDDEERWSTPLPRHRDAAGAYDNSLPSQDGGGGIPPSDPDPWGVRADEPDDDDDASLAKVVAALHHHLQKKIQKKNGYQPPPPQGSAKPSKPTTPPGPPAAPDPNTAPQPIVLNDDSVAAATEVETSASAPAGVAPSAAIDDPDTERADGSPDRPRAANGQWGSGGAAEAEVAHAKAEGGSTFDPSTGGHPEHGYAVAMHQDRVLKIEGSENLTPDKLKSYVEANHDVLTNDKQARVGTWFNRDDNTWYLDIPHVENHLATAATLGRDRGEKAIYDLKRKEEVQAHDYEEAIQGKGRFTGRTDSDDEPPPTGPGPGVRPTHYDAGADGGGDEAPRGQGSQSGRNGHTRGPGATRDEARVDWNPDQPRAEDGKFGEGGGAPAQVSPPSTRLTSALSIPEQKAVRAWAGPEYDDINSVARGKLSTFFESTKETKATIDKLDSAIAKAQVTDPMTVYRGMHETRLGSLKVGDVMTDKGFVATSTAEHTASNFAAASDAMHHGGGAIVEIHVPRGAHALSVDPVGGTHNDEHEVLLPRDSKFRILAVHAPAGPRKPVRVEAELV